MTPQQIVFYAGIVSFVVAAALAAWSVYTFFALDVRGVMDDLSGRRRAVGQTGMGGRRKRSSGGVRHRPNSGLGEPIDARRASALEVRAVDDEDNVDTVVDAALRPAAVPQSEVNSDKTRASAYKSAAQGAADTYHPNDVHMGAHEVDAPTVVDGGDGIPTAVERIPALPVFRVSRRIVLIHSDEVISAG